MKQAWEITIWDPLIRIFHWSLAGGFAVAYLTEDDFMALHVAAGYLVAGLLILRLAWGLVGSRHARFSSFVHRPSVVADYLRDVFRHKARRHLGHNPAGGAMVLALLLMLLLTAASGLALYGGSEVAGPFAAFMSGAPGWSQDMLEEVHEFLANATLALIVLHIGGVLLASWQHRENLVGAMLHGRKTVASGQDHA